MVQLNGAPVWASAMFGLASAAAWGAGDFCGGVATKRAGGYAVVIGAHVVGVVAFLALALGSGEAMPGAVSLMWCGVAGLAGAIGLVALYRALAEGRMGIAAPVSGMLSAAVPAAAGAAAEGLPRWLTLGGFALALIAVWLIARSGDDPVRPRELGLPVLAGAGFGLFILIIGRASGTAVFWPLVAARVASLTILPLIALAGRQSLRLPARALLPVVIAGIFDAGGNAFLVMAAHAGRLDVAAVLSSLYPAGTVLLAWIVLKEQITRWQLTGLLTAGAAIVAITAG
ncbi:MAG TPA: DMT family transporter [Vicinamibacterales bacterium]